MLPDHKIFQIIQNTWFSIFGTPVQQQLGTVSFDKSNQILSARIFINGAIDGAIILDCPHQLAWDMATFFYQAEQDVIPEKDVSDILGELVNVIGGQIKPFLPRPNYLSLPKINKSLLEIDDNKMTVINKVGFEYQKQPIQLMVTKNIS